MRNLGVAGGGGGSKKHNLPVCSTSGFATERESRYVYATMVKIIDDDEKQNGSKKESENKNKRRKNHRRFRSTTSRQTSTGVRTKHGRKTYTIFSFRSFRRSCGIRKRRNIQPVALAENCAAEAKTHVACASAPICEGDATRHKPTAL